MTIRASLWCYVQIFNSLSKIRNSSAINGLMIHLWIQITVDKTNDRFEFKHQKTFFMYLLGKEPMESICKEEALSKKKKEKTWKVIGLAFSLYIDHKRTNQMFYRQLNWVATAHSFLLVQRVRLDARHCPVASCNVLVCQPKFVPKPVRHESKNMLSAGKSPQCCSLSAQNVIVTSCISSSSYCGDF